MQIKTVIGIPARGSGPVVAPSGKKSKATVDTVRLRKLSDQLVESMRSPLTLPGNWHIITNEKRLPIDGQPKF